MGGLFVMLCIALCLLAVRVLTDKDEDGQGSKGVAFCTLILMIMISGSATRKNTETNTPAIISTVIVYICNIALVYYIGFVGKNRRVPLVLCGIIYMLIKIGNIYSFSPDCPRGKKTARESPPLDIWPLAGAVLFTAFFDFSLRGYMFKWLSIVEKGGVKSLIANIISFLVTLASIGLVLGQIVYGAYLIRTKDFNSVFSEFMGYTENDSVMSLWTRVRDPLILLLI
tara:strand:+ start:863 stop:1543 length:681 start_codon:yes stop_codon:yes gene_type:complete